MNEKEIYYCKDCGTLDNSNSHKLTDNIDYCLKWI